MQIEVIHTGKHHSFKIGDKPHVVRAAGDGRKINYDHSGHLTKEPKDGLWCRMKYPHGWGEPQLVQWWQMKNAEKMEQLAKGMIVKNPYVNSIERGRRVVRA